MAADTPEHNYLSYSSSNTLKACEQKFKYYKLDKVKVDRDSNQTRIHFDIGTVFHQILEDNMHELEGLNVSKLDKYFDRTFYPRLGFEINWIEHGPLIIAMLRKYKIMHKKAGLKAIKCELELSDPKFLGYVDIILGDEKGNWWISDNKTAATLDQNLVPRLPKDRQLNLYAFHAATIAEELGLDVKKYKGCLYRVSTKSKLKRRKTHSFAEHTQRLFEAVQAYQITVPKERMNPEAERADFDNLFVIKEEIRLGKRQATKNLNNCTSYFRPCEYWSKCHGRPYTEPWADFSIITTLDEDEVAGCE